MTIPRTIVVKSAPGLFACVLVFIMCMAGACRAAGDFNPTVNEKNGMLIFFADKSLSVRYDLVNGVFNLLGSGEVPVIIKARAEAVIVVGGEKATISSAGAKGLKWDSPIVKERTGAWFVVRVTIPGENGVPDLIQVFKFYHDKPYLGCKPYIVTELSFDMRGHKPIAVERMSPVIVEGKSGGGVFLGKTPDKIRILENGYKNQLDFWVRLVSAKAGSDSNWSSALYDPATHNTFVGGYLTQFVSLGSVLANNDSSESVTDSASGMAGLSYYHARGAFSPMRRVADGDYFVSDEFFMTFSAGAPLDALELFGETMKIHNMPGLYSGFIPSYWDTWYSGYNQDISEENILKNIDAAADTLAPYGMNTLLIDAGWQIDDGDWNANDKFPHGMKLIADRIREKGLLPAIWFAPFVANKSSAVVKEHPDWFLDLDTIGNAVISKDARALDISNPDAQKWLSEVVARVTHEWGFKMLKVDFTYYSLAGKKYFQKGRTKAEIFREAYQIIRDAAGPDVYILAVGVPVSYHAGLVNAMRTGLDNAPRWGAENGYTAQGALPSYRSMIRRYFLNGRVWMNDPDVIYTGMDSTSKRWNQPPQPRHELLAWISAVGLSGTTLELADKPVDLDADQLRLVRSVLPVYHGSARPIDLFVKDNPEILDLKIEKPFGDWHVAGLFNWGENSGVDGQLPISAHDVQIDFSEIGLTPSAEYLIYDFWNDKYVGAFVGRYSAHLEPRTVSVIAIRESLGRPQFLSTNRHITMGATDIKSIKWNDDDNSLTGVQESVAGFEYHLSFFIPKGYEFKEARISSGESKTVISDNRSVANVFFTAPSAGDTEWKLLFSKSTNK